MYQFVNKDKILHWLNYFQKILKVREAACISQNVTIIFSLPSFNPGAGLPTDKKKGGPSAGDVEAIKVRMMRVPELSDWREPRWDRPAAWPSANHHRSHYLIVLRKTMVILVQEKTTLTCLFDQTLI